MSSTLYIHGRAVAGRVHLSESARLQGRCPSCGLPKAAQGLRSEARTAHGPTVSQDPARPCLPCQKAMAVGIEAGAVERYDEPGGHAPLRSGQPWTDDDGLVFRVVRDSLLGEPGWATSATWADKLGCTWRAFAHLVKHGVFDAAIGVDSGERRYRCLSPSKAKLRLVEWNKKVKREQVSK